MEIIPSGELTGIELSLREVSDDLALLPGLKKKAEDLVVTDQTSFLEAGTLVAQVDGIGGKDGGGRLQRYFDITNTVINFLRNKRTMVQTAKDEIKTILNKKRNDWAELERQATAKEQAELDKKNQKAGAPRQQVLANIPTTAGKRKSTTWPIRIEDANKLLNQWKKGGKYGKDLRPFIILDEQALAKEAREMQDPEAFMKRFPGIFNEKKETV